MRRDVTDSFVSYALTTINGHYGALPAWCVEDEDALTLGGDLIRESEMLAGHIALRMRAVVDRRAAKAPKLEQLCREAAD